MPTNKQDLNQFGSAKPAQSGDPQLCAQCEAMLTDALDGTLSAADQAAFDRAGAEHGATLIADVPNFTNTMPTIQIDEIVE